MVDTRDLKSLGSNPVRVRVPLRAFEGELRCCHRLRVHSYTLRLSPCTSLLKSPESLRVTFSINDLRIAILENLIIMKTGRNAPCLCGSGLKFKKCCIYKDEVAITNTESMKEKDQVVPISISPFSPFFKLMPNMKFKGFRLRFIFSGFHYRPLNETFNDFLLQVIRLTFGKEWCARQRGMSTASKHVVFQWFGKVDQFRRECHEKIETESTPYGLVCSVDTDGPHQSLLSLGWDFFCLQSEGKFILPPVYLDTDLR